MSKSQNLFIAFVATVISSCLGLVLYKQFSSPETFEAVEEPQVNLSRDIASLAHDPTLLKRLSLSHKSIVAGKDTFIFGDEKLTKASVYSNENGDWKITETVMPGAITDEFARATALAGEFAFFSLPYNFTGFVDIYQKDHTGKWAVQQTITGPQNRQKFGLSLASDGNFLAVMDGDASDEYIPGRSGPFIHIYTLEDNGEWKPLAVPIQSPVYPPNRDFWFSHKLAFNKGLLAIIGGKKIDGAPKNDRVYMFSFEFKDSGIFVEEHTALKSGSDYPYDSIALDNGTLLAGCSTCVAKGSSGSTGEVHIYERKNGSWDLAQTLVAENTSEFGRDVAVSNRLMVVTSRRQTYIYRKYAKEWVARAILKTPGAKINSITPDGRWAAITGAKETFILDLQGM